jgi:hypothetical protein
MKTISIARNFTDCPGARYKSEGPFSGEEFRETFLEPLFTPVPTEKIQVIMDGVEGYATSFLEECFGGLARKYGKDLVKKWIAIVSNEDPLLIEEIYEYIEEANNGVQ